MMYEYIYLKLSHSEQELTDQLVQKLEAAGHKVWLGQDAVNDAQQQRQMQFAIERSEAFILVLGPETPEANGNMRELDAAQEAGKPIFLVQLGPVILPGDLETALAGRPRVDLSGGFEAGLEELITLLSGSESSVGESVPAVEIAPSGDFFGGEHFGQVPALPGEQIVWSDSGLFWYKKWKTLVRVMVTQTDRRLIFFWDERDIWKWKPREVDELEEAFPMVLSLDQITAVGEVHRPKAFLIFATGKPYVEITVTGNQLHRFSL